MKRSTLFIAMLVFLWAGLTLAAGTQYELRVDGLACPFCAYGIEKKLMKTAGVEAVEIDLDKGLVIVSAEAGATFSEAQMKKLVDDAGFTLRGMTTRPAGQ